MPFVFSRLYRRMGAGYFRLYPVFELLSAFLVCLATIGLFALYTDTTTMQFWQVVLFAEACVAVAVGWVMWKAWRLVQPVVEWMEERTDPLAAWCAAVKLPREITTRHGWQPFLIVGLPIAVLFTIELDLPAYSALIIFAGSAVAVAYAAILHFFASELFMRPVIEDITRDLPSDFTGSPIGVPLRWKLLGALPLINIVTGVVVSGLSTDGTASLDDLGLDVVVAVLVAFTVSLELTVLVTKSVLGPVDDLLEATESVTRGELDARVAVTSGDELGRLAGSFNEMMQGLTERDALRDALGSYVAPEVADRVLSEGELIAGQEREVTVMVVDVRDFTPFAERSSPRETVAFLNELFGLVVPCVTTHGGHANKFLGDGLLAVFGAPDRLDDHADRAVAAARDVANGVAKRFGPDVGVGIGINSGSVVVGTVGGGGRLEFAVIGDPVNIAARVEAKSRHTGDVVLLTEETRRLLREGSIDGLSPRGSVALKGVSDPVTLYSLPVESERRSTGISESAKADV